MSDSPGCLTRCCRQRAQGLAVSRPHTSDPWKQVINGERGSCGCKKEPGVGHLLPAEGRGEQALCLSQFFSPPLRRLSSPLLLEPGRRWGRGAAAGGSDSSLGQQDEEDGLEEVPKAANSSHEPVGAKAGVSVHHAFCDVCLTRREQRSSEMP